MTQKIALLTGGARGIGLATAELLKQAGYTVIAPPRATLDLAQPSSVAHFVAHFDAPRLDALVLCAGEWFSQPLHETGLYEFDHQYQLNVVSNWTLIKWLSDALSGGVVVAVSSTQGFIGGVNTAPYACAKAAEIALIQGFARQRTQTRYNIVCPGLTDTDMGAEVLATGDANPNVPGQQPAAVAQVIVSLVTGTDTGKVIRVVGGQATEAKWSW